MNEGYWSSPWPGEDFGPGRVQCNRLATGPNFAELGQSAVRTTCREAIPTTMMVLRDPGEVFVLRHTAGQNAIAWVEKIDAITLEPVARSVDLAGGATWPGGMAAHKNGSLYVVFGRYAHRLDAQLNVVASRELPRLAPYNSFVIMENQTTMIS